MKKISKKKKIKFDLDDIIPSNGGYCKESLIDGTVIFIFNKEVNYDAIKQYTDYCYTRTWLNEDDEEVIDFAEYDPSNYYSEIAGELEDGYNYDDLISIIKIGKTPKEKLFLFFKEVIDNAHLIEVNESGHYIDEINNDEYLNNVIKKIGKNLVIFIRNYDHIYDY